MDSVLCLPVPSGKDWSKPIIILVIFFWSIAGTADVTRPESGLWSCSSFLSGAVSRILLWLEVDYQGLTDDEVNVLREFKDLGFEPLGTNAKINNYLRAGRTDRQDLN